MADRPDRRDRPDRPDHGGRPRRDGPAGGRGPSGGRPPGGRPPGGRGPSDRSGPPDRGDPRGRRDAGHDERAGFGWGTGRDGGPPPWERRPGPPDRGRPPERRGPRPPGGGGQPYSTGGGGRRYQGGGGRPYPTDRPARPAGPHDRREPWDADRDRPPDRSRPHDHGAWPDQAPRQDRARPPDWDRGRDRPTGDRRWDHPPDRGPRPGDRRPAGGPPPRGQGGPRGRWERPGPPPRGSSGPRGPWDRPGPQPDRGFRPGPGPDRRGPARPQPDRWPPDEPPPFATLDPADVLGQAEELVAGRRPVEEAFAAGRPAIRLLVVPARRDALERLVLHATRLRIPIVEVEGGTLTAIAGFDGHQGIALVVEPRRWSSIDEVLAAAATAGDPPFVLVMDSLEDPQNVGTLLRTAEASGAHGVVFPTHHQAPLSPSAVKASAGAIEHLRLVPVDDLAGALVDLHARGLRIVGTDMDAPLTAREADLRGPIAIVIGSEGRGLGAAVRRRCDLLVRIPMRGRVGSLNAAVAGSILAYETLTQRGPIEWTPPEARDGEPGPGDEVADASPLSVADGGAPTDGVQTEGEREAESLLPGGPEPVASTDEAAVPTPKRRATKKATASAESAAVADAAPTPSVARRRRRRPPPTPPRWQTQQSRPPSVAHEDPRRSPPTPLPRSRPQWLRRQARRRPGSDPPESRRPATDQAVPDPPRLTHRRAEPYHLRAFSGCLRMALCAPT